MPGSLLQALHVILYISVRWADTVLFKRRHGSLKGGRLGKWKNGSNGVATVELNCSLAWPHHTHRYPLAWPRWVCSLANQQPLLEALTSLEGKRQEQSILFLFYRWGNWGSETNTRQLSTGGITKSNVSGNFLNSMWSRKGKGYVLSWRKTRGSHSSYH